MEILAFESINWIRMGRSCCKFVKLHDQSLISRFRERFMKLGNFLSRTIHTRCMVYEKGWAKRRCIDITVDRRQSTFNKMELIFIWYINNSRNKVGYLDFINKEPGGMISVLDLPVRKLVPGMYKLLSKLFSFILLYISFSRYRISVANCQQ